MLLESFANVISDPVYIMSIILAALGVAVALISKRITKLVRKTSEVKPDDKLYLILKLTGLTLILVGFVLLTFGGLVKLG